MTSLLASRRRAEEFARHIDERRTSHDPTLAPLLELVAMLRPAPAEPAPEFCAALRERLISVAAELPPAERVEPAPDRTGTRLVPTRVRVTGMATAFAAASVLVAVAVMARGALPGDALYPVKRQLEGAQVAVATNPESRGYQHFAQAENRLDELTALIGGQPVDDADRRQIQLIGSALNDFTEETRTGARLLTEAFRADGETAPLAGIREHAAMSTAKLAKIGPMLPAVLQPPYDDAVQTLTQLDETAAAFCANCEPEGFAADPETSDGSRDGAPEDISSTSPADSGRTTTPRQTPLDLSDGPDPDGTQGPGSDELEPTATLPNVELPPQLEHLGLPTVLPLPAVLQQDSDLFSMFGQDSSEQQDDNADPDLSEPEVTEPTSSKTPQTPTTTDSTEPTTESPESTDPPARVSLRGILGDLLPFL